MRELSLHILDLIENSITAGATVVAVTVDTDGREDRLGVTVEDDGPGFRVPMEVATDPFHTTKPGKRTGLGLSLLRGSVERAGGGMEIGRSGLGGASVKVWMRKSHVNLIPMGDLAATVSSVVCTNPGVDLRVCCRTGGKESCVSAREIRGERSGGNGREVLRVAREMAQVIEKWTVEKGTDDER